MGVIFRPSSRPGFGLFWCHFWSLPWFARGGFLGGLSSPSQALSVSVFCRRFCAQFAVPRPFWARKAAPHRRITDQSAFNTYQQTTTLKDARDTPFNIYQRAAAFTKSKATDRHHEVRGNCVLHSVGRGFWGQKMTAFLVWRLDAFQIDFLRKPIENLCLARR